jgi:type II secretory pathway component PulF
MAGTELFMRDTARPSPADPASSAANPISYANLGTASPRRWTAKRIASFYVPTLVLLAALHGIMAGLVPRFESLFADFALAIPGSTKMLFEASRAYRGTGWVIASAGLLLLPIVWILSISAGRRDRLYRVATTLLTGALVTWVVVGLFVPMVSLIDSASSAKGR